MFSLRQQNETQYRDPIRPTRWKRNGMIRRRRTTTHLRMKLKPRQHPLMHPKTKASQHRSLRHGQCLGSRPVRSPKQHKNSASDPVPSLQDNPFSACRPIRTLSQASQAKIKPIRALYLQLRRLHRSSDKEVTLALAHKERLLWGGARRNVGQ